MPSTVWTEVAEPICEALPLPVDHDVKSFTNTLFQAVHTNRGPNLSHDDTFAAQTAEITRLQDRLPDLEVVSGLTDLLHAARFCQAHVKFQDESVKLSEAVKSQGFTEVQGHKIYERLKYVGDQTSRIAADSRVLGWKSAGPSQSEFDPSVYMTFLHDLRVCSLDDLPEKANTSKSSNVFTGKKKYTMNDTRKSINTICTATEVFYRQKHQKVLDGLEEHASTEGDSHA